jgi:hypothetical protein
VPSIFTCFNIVDIIQIHISVDQGEVTKQNSYIPVLINYFFRPSVLVTVQNCGTHDINLLTFKNHASYI